MAGRPPRRAYLDWMRGIAVLCMIEWHVLDSWTVVPGRGGLTWTVITIIGGTAAPLFLFLVMQRVPSLKAPARERYSVYWTNLGVGALAAGLIWIFGLKAYLIIQLTVLLTAGSAGVWLFYVQHQFEGVYWERGGQWDYATAALKGSSFYKLPKVLQWFSGNIGFHHAGGDIGEYLIAPTHDGARGGTGLGRGAGCDQE